MPLLECPHVMVRCPHRHRACLDAASKDCLYIKQARAVSLSALAALQNIAPGQLPKEWLEGLEEARSCFGMSRPKGPTSR